MGMIRYDANITSSVGSQDAEMGMHPLMNFNRFLIRSISTLNLVENLKLFTYDI